MPNINLIHEQRVALRQEERKVRGLLVAWLGVSAAVLIAGGALFLDAEQTRSKTAALKHKMTRIQPILNEIDDTKKELSIMGPKLTSLQDAQTFTQRWGKLLDHLTRNTPSGLWLTQLRCRENKKEGSTEISFLGVSLDQRGVGDFMLRLKKFEDLQKVDLKYTSAEKTAESENIKFEVIGTIAGTDEADKEKKKKPLAEKKSDMKEVGA